jgi:ABC-type transport system involved in cytochrome c biogenesis ATPase subunit
MLFYPVYLVSIGHQSGIDNEMTYVDTPEFLNRVESHDLFQQVIPVVALQIKRC